MRGLRARLHPRGDGRLVALVAWDVVAPIDQLVWQVLLPDVVALEVVRELVADADAVRLHPAIARCPQVHRDVERSELEHVGHRRAIRPPDGVRLRRRRDVGRRLGQRVLGLGQPDPVERRGRRHGDLEGPRIRVPDVLGRADDQPPGDEPRVLTGGDHRREPVQRRVRIVAAEALDERRDGVVVPVAGPVVGEDALLGGRLDVLESRGDVAGRVADALVGGEGGRTLEDVQGRSRVATGERHQMLEGVVAEGDPAVRTERAGQAAVRVDERAADDGRDLVVGQRLEPPHAHPRQQRGVHLEVGVLGRRPDQGDGAVLDVRQQRVLLRLVEPVDLVEEEDRAGAMQGQPVLRLGDRGPDLDHAGHDRRQRDEMGADRVGQQSREARLARPRRAPQQGRGQVATGHAAAERSAFADEVALPDELLEAARAHARGERLALGRGMEERLGLGAGRAAGGGHGPMVARRAARPAGQMAELPVSCVMAQIASMRMINPPPMSVMRRTSRPT